MWVLTKGKKFVKNSMSYFMDL